MKNLKVGKGKSSITKKKTIKNLGLKLRVVMVLMLREKEEVLENTRHQLRQKEKESDELKDQCSAFRLYNDSLRYIMLCQDSARRYLDSKRSGDSVQGYSCPSCITVVGPPREFCQRYIDWRWSKETKYYETWSFNLVLALQVWGDGG